ncbi:MAG: hypothetical protein ACYCW6_21035 [Candidatus Xenobia bacterium]
MRGLALVRSEAFRPLLDDLAAHDLELERVSAVDTARRLWQAPRQWQLLLLELSCVIELGDDEMPDLPVVILAEHFRVGDAHRIVNQAIYYADPRTPAAEILETLATVLPAHLNPAQVPPSS